MTENILLGKKREGAQLVNLNAADPFSESMIFAPGMDSSKESEFLKSWPQGATICGTLKALRTTKPQDPGKDPQDYACLEADDGTLFRVYTPGQLRYTLETRAGIGAYVEMTYSGMQRVEKIGRDCHQFEVLSNKQNLEDAPKSNNH